jgi:hypothetical protein
MLHELGGSPFPATMRCELHLLNLFEVYAYGHCLLHAMPFDTPE